MTDDDRKREQARLRMQRYRQRRREAAEQQPPARPCDHCGAPLPQGRYLGDRRRYCSATCRWAAATIRRRQQLPPNE